MDILREGPNVMVMEPKSLIDEVQGQLREALDRYSQD